MSTLTGPMLPPRAGGPARQLIVLLHGVGADGSDLIELAPALAEHLPHAAFVAPDAPQPCDMAPFGRQWFSLQDRHPGPLATGARQTAPLLDAFLDEQLRHHRLEDRQMALLGFSQGTMMALFAAPRRARPVAAVLGYSGALLGGAALAAEIRSKPPVMLIHGDADDVVPMTALAAAEAELGEVGMAVRTMLRPGLGHGIDPEGVAAGLAFLQEMLPKA